MQGQVAAARFGLGVQRLRFEWGYFWSIHRPEQDRLPELERIKQCGIKWFDLAKSGTFCLDLLSLRKSFSFTDFSLFLKVEEKVWSTPHPPMFYSHFACKDLRFVWILFFRVWGHTRTTKEFIRRNWFNKFRAPFLKESLEIELNS